MLHSRVMKATYPISASLLALGVVLTVAQARAQQPQATEIHIDQECRVLPDQTEHDAGQKSRPKSTLGICHVEKVHDPDEKKEHGDVKELEYSLRNITADPVVFVVEHAVPKGWGVNSYPLPDAYDGFTAFFRVQAKPGEEVMLYVGLRKGSKTITTATTQSPAAK